MSERIAILSRVWVVLAALCIATIASAAPQERADPPLAPACHAFSDNLLPPSSAESRLDWVCDGEVTGAGAAVTWLLFTQWERDEPPLYFTAPITKFADARIAALDAEGRVRARDYAVNDARPVLASAQFSLELPEAMPDTRAYLVAIERAHSPLLVGGARLERDVTHADNSSRLAMVLVAVVAGMLLMPFLFDLIFFLVLRERFVLLHAGVALSGLIWVMTTGGVITAFLQLPVTALAIASQFSFALTAGLTGFFIADFLEPGALPARGRMILRTVSGVTIAVGGICAFQFDFLLGDARDIYYLSFAPLLPAYLIAIGWALWRGSRAAWFLAAAWAPILLAVVERLLHKAGWHESSPMLEQALFFAIGIEVIMIAMGVADRFLLIRRERDKALTRARMMKQLSERDSLTGLFNRRVIEERFADLRRSNFTTLAVLDLDHFKRINDTFGHARGDRVLAVVGEVLGQGGEDCMAFRMGGEEFLLLLRGRNAIERAERLRQEISRAIAEEDMGFVVTASMGVVEAMGGALPEAGFATLYARADRLLYEAKAGGRNRLVSESIKAFRPRRAERRVAA